MKGIKPITLNEITHKFDNITPEELKKWKEVYPAVQVENEIRKCEIWALDTRRKNYRRSISKWLDNVQKNHTTPLNFYDNALNVEYASEIEIAENKRLSKEWEQKLPKNIIQYAIYANNDKIQFIFPNSESLEIFYNDKHFFKKCASSLKRMKIIN